MMRTLDFSRPYGEVWGGAGLSAYSQDGREFALDGRPLGVGAEAIEPLPMPTVEPLIPPLPVHVAPLSPSEMARLEALSSRGWRRLDGDERKEFQELRARDRVIPGISASRSPVESSLPPALGDEEDYSERSDEELRTLVEIAGGAWAGRDAALAFLEE